MDPIAREILAVPALTLDGLAIKARVAKWAASDFWTESNEDVDWDKLCVRELIDAVIQMAATT